jgi:hypothetical protein
MSGRGKLIRSKKAEQFDSENELWETRQLGASPEHAIRSSVEEDISLVEAMGLQLLTFRIQKPVVDQLRLLAKLEGIGYQPLMRKVLIRYVLENNHRLKRTRTPKETSKQAEQALTEAIKYKDIIPALPPMTNERFEAESQYSTSLGTASTLFREANANCSDPILKKHLKLRLKQIGVLLEDNS